MESKKPMSERDMEEQLQGIKMVILGQTGGDQEAMMRALAGKGILTAKDAACYIDKNMNIQRTPFCENFLRRGEFRPPSSLFLRSSGFFTSRYLTKPRRASAFSDIPLFHCHKCKVAKLRWRYCSRGPSHLPPSLLSRPPSNLPSFVHKRRMSTGGMANSQKDVRQRRAKAPRHASIWE